MTLLTPEDFARQIKTLYEDYYNDSLDSVEATWSAIEDVTLDDFAQRSITADPTTIEAQTAFPALAIAVGDMTKVEGKGTQLFHDFYDLEVTLAYFLKALDPHTLGILLMRHMEATLEFLNAHPHLEKGEDVTIREVRMQPSANTFASGGNTLVKGLRVQFTVRFLQYGF